ncbi:MAG TPA: cysteine peptidase family C39 domain-containing protein [Anaerolineae bacterium]|nr:cysteine peptidase family C39 domain-containing protein [Anaerolineae bacterium]
MVLAYHGAAMPEADVRRILKTKPHSGAHPINLLKLSDYGFDAWPFEGTSVALKQHVLDGLPVIVFLWTGSLHHWAQLGGVDYLHSVVVVGFDDAMVMIHDPALPGGPVELSWSEFGDAWRYSRQMMAVIEPHRSQGPR